MMPRRSWIIILCALVVRLSATGETSIGSKAETLLQCSSFHYEEHVLRKLVKLEHNIGLITDVEIKKQTEDLRLENDETKRQLSELKAEIVKIKKQSEKTKLEQNETKNEIVKIKEQSYNTNKETSKLKTQHEHMKQEMLAKLEELPQMGNRTSVAFTACDASIQGHIVKFSTVRSNVGVSNLSGFKSTGKFICEHKGLYLVSVTIMSNADSDQFQIWKNGIWISRTFTSAHSPHQSYHSSTGVASMELNVGDEVHVDTTGDLASVYSVFSCITIVKIN